MDEFTKGFIAGAISIMGLWAIRAIIVDAMTESVLHRRRVKGADAFASHLLDAERLCRITASALKEEEREVNQTVP